MRLGALRVAIYPNDHRPAHVHVVGPFGEAVFVLNCPGGPTKLREAYGFDSRALRVIEASLNEVLRKLCDDWRVLHGAD